MAVSRIDGYSEDVRAWLVECLPRAVVFARSLVRDENEAEDAVQECVYRLLKRSASYDLPRDGSRLLFRAVTNECINRITRRQGAMSLEVLGDDDQPLADSLADPHAEQPVQILLRDELRRVLDQALDQLPVAQRAALQLKCLGQSLEEIAQALSITANHAGVLVYRARRAIREKVAAYDRGKGP